MVFLILSEAWRSDDVDSTLLDMYVPQGALSGSFLILLEAWRSADAKSTGHVFAARCSFPPSLWAWRVAGQVNLISGHAESLFAHRCAVGFLYTWLQARAAGQS